MSEMSVRPGWDTGDWSGMPPVTIHPYDPRWTEQYERAKAEIALALAGLGPSFLGAGYRVEHVGSTSVPGLGARNGIDILIGLGAGLDGPGGIDACVERLRSIGFSHHFSQPGWTHLSGNGCKLHLTPFGSTFWSEWLGFRDYLRRHPEAASAYERVKLDLVREHGPNGQAYVEGKTAFVRSILEQARREESSVNVRKGRYRHFKGKEYEVIGVARHSETMEDLVVYKPLYESESEYWIRPLAMFLETVEHDGKVSARFEYIGP
jgi:GrpB-like predicted nucleotidyltransferase (UPF0157 family)